MFGLIGYPLGHSFSAKYFAEKFKRENLNEQYCLFPLNEIKELDNLLEENVGLQGLNVTIPYKETVMTYLDELSPDASAIGAVNVIKIFKSNNGEKPYLKGYNTDWEGFSLSLSPLLTGNERKALVLGTGGASKAITYALSKLGIMPTLVSRRMQEDTITYEKLDKSIIEDNLLIVNTTPLGMFPHTESYPLIPYEHLTSRHICYDLVYNPLETEFMKRCAAMGATTKNGLEMLHIQAELSWKIWNGR